jgi:GAF domain
MRIMGANSASVHFPDDPQQQRYLYEVSYGPVGRRFLKECQPHTDELGRQAIAERKPKFIPDLSRGHEIAALERLNPKVVEKGIKAIAAFPLVVNQYNGVLYLYFQRPHLFTQDEIDWVQLFVDWAVKVLTLVIKRAVGIMGADLGMLSRLDPSTQSRFLTPTARWCP